MASRGCFLALSRSDIFHLPKLLPLGLLIFWIIRVRFTKWRPTLREPGCGA